MFTAKRSDAGDMPEIGGARGGAPGTHIAKGVVLQGDFTSQGDVVIDGDVHGQVTTSGHLTIGPDAKVKANVSANDALIAGSVEGMVNIKKRMELKSTAQVLGDVTCETAAIEAGACVNGKVVIGQMKTSSNGVTTKKTS